jgi:hypothetical protein
MALNNAAMVVAANALQGVLVAMQLHSGDPGAAGTANTTSAARQAISWGAPTGPGTFGLSASINFTGVAANGAATYISLWSQVAAGQYTVTALNLTGSAT